MSHTTDWFPGRRSQSYRDNWDSIFGENRDDDEQVETALKYFKQGGCCSSSCDCSGRKPK